MHEEELRYPIGRYAPQRSPDQDTVKAWIYEIEIFPSRLKDLTSTASKAMLNWKYRPGGWSVKQLVHHCADSHMNSLMRFKLALTEESPTIKPYEEALWAELADGCHHEIEDSLLLLTGLHRKWVILLRSLTDAQLQREFFHPAAQETRNLAETIGNYAWHCNHHLAHVKSAFSSGGKYD